MASQNSINNKTINANISIGNTAVGATSSDLDFLKSRSGGAITTGDVLGQITFQGQDGTQYTTASKIVSTSSGTIASTSVASNLEFFTHPDSTTASTQRMTISSTGAVNIRGVDLGSNTSIGTLTVKRNIIGALQNNVQTTSDTQECQLGLLKDRSGGVITSGDKLGSILFGGFDGTDYIIGAQILSTSSGTIAANRVAGNLQFFTAPDSIIGNTQRMLIASTGAVTINTPDSGTGLTVSGGGITATTGSITASAGSINAISATSANPLNVSTNTTNDATSSSYAFRKQRGAAAITSGDQLGAITFAGYDGSAVITGSKIVSVNSGTVAANRIASDLQFFTHPDSTTASTLRMTINTAGSVIIQTPDAAAPALTINGNGANIFDSTATATAPSINFIKNRTGGVITTGDILGSIFFLGNDSAANFVSAKITSTSSGTIGVGRIASNIALFTAPDSVSATIQRMLIASTGAVTINTPDSGVGLTVSGGGIICTSGAIWAQSGNVQAENNAVAVTAPQFNLLKTRSFGVISSGDVLGSLTFQGYDGSAYQTGSSITATTSGTIAAGRIPSNLTFATAPDAVSTAITRMTIATTGAVTIATPDSGVGLTVSGGGATVTSGNITATSGNLVLTGATSSTTANLTIGGFRFVHSFGTNSTFIGPSAGNYTLSGANNTGVGQVVLSALTSGAQNTCIGSTSGLSLTTGGFNTFVGYNTTGVISGTLNTCIGYQCGNSYTGAESNNILLAAKGVVGESNVTKIGYINGTASTQTSCFIDGIRGITTTAADAIAVLISSTGQLGTVSSSIRFKENVQDMADYSSDLMKLRPVIFNYIKDESKSIQVGLIAEEVEEIMPRLVARDAEKEIETVKYHELPALLLNEIQKLNARIKLLEEKLGV